MQRYVFILEILDKQELHLTLCYSYQYYVSSNLYDRRMVPKYNWFKQVSNITILCEKIIGNFDKFLSKNLIQHFSNSSKFFRSSLFEQNINFFKILTNREDPKKFNISPEHGTYKTGNKLGHLSSFRIQY